MISRIWLPPGWPRLLLLALPLALAAAGLLAVIVYSPSPQAPAATVPPAPNPNGDQAAGADAFPAQGGLLVQVSGAVANPGLYRLAKGERVSAAVAAAGGITADADPEKLPDLAARLRDGQHVKVPSRRSPASTRTTRATAANLNSATSDELSTIPGFSVELAAAAVRYRTQYGGFVTTRELVTVLGMSESDFVQARRYVTV